MLQVPAPMLSSGKDKGHTSKAAMHQGLEDNCNMAALTLLQRRYCGESRLSLSSHAVTRLHTQSKIACWTEWQMPGRPEAAALCQAERLPSRETIQLLQDSG